MSTATLRVTSNNHVRRSRSAFTLVELLVVITIIAILASLGAAAVMNALWNAKQTKIKVEVDNLATAMMAFKEKYGTYPPADLSLNNTNTASYKALRAFVVRAFPRYNTNNLQTDLQNAGAPTTFNPAQALVFWLRGFSPDAAHPFTGAGERVPFFNFDKTRLYPPLGFTDSDGDGIRDPNEPFVAQIYLAPGAANTPFLYYDFRSYSDNVNNPADVEQPREVLITSPIDSASQGYAVPYVLEVDNNKIPDEPDTYANPDSFQIISAGQDGFFGTTNATNGAKARLYPIGINYDETDSDNITNFCEINNLNDKKP
jgi:prepilin-type N-terminal cleavage/methylation domain-containing protein